MWLTATWCSSLSVGWFVVFRVGWAIYMRVRFVSLDGWCFALVCDSVGVFVMIVAGDVVCIVGLRFWCWY